MVALVPRHQGQKAPNGSGYSYSGYHLHKAVEAKDPAPLANFLLTLAKGLANVYSKKSIKDGSAGFQFAVSRAFQTLEEGMAKIGLFPLHEV
jgi:hypothetical protein